MDPTLWKNLICSRQQKNEFFIQTVDKNRKCHNKTKKEHMKVLREWEGVT